MPLSTPSIHGRHNAKCKALGGKGGKASVDYRWKGWWGEERQSVVEWQKTGQQMRRRRKEGRKEAGSDGTGEDKYIFPLSLIKCQRKTSTSNTEEFLLFHCSCSTLPLTFLWEKKKRKRWLGQDKREKERQRWETGERKMGLQSERNQGSVQIRIIKLFVSLTSSVIDNIFENPNTVQLPYITRTESSKLISMMASRISVVLNGDQD